MFAYMSEGRGLAKDTRLPTRAAITALTFGTHADHDHAIPFCFLRRQNHLRLQQQASQVSIGQRISGTSSCAWPLRRPTRWIVSVATNKCCGGRPANSSARLSHCGVSERRPPRVFPFRSVALPSRDSSKDTPRIQNGVTEKVKGGGRKPSISRSLVRLNMAQNRGRSRCSR